MIEKEDYKLGLILDVLPKNKSKVSFNTIWVNVNSEINSTDELRELMPILIKLGFIQATPKVGYSITEKGLDFIAGEESSEDYIIRMLNENGGHYNFLHLYGKKFKSETEKFAIIQKLTDKDYIRKVQGSLGQTYIITERYFAENMDKYKDIALSILKKRANDEIWWEEVVNRIGIPKEYGNELKNLLEHDGYIFTSSRTKEGHAVKVLPKTTAYFYDKPKVHVSNEQLHVEQKPIKEVKESMVAEKENDKGYVRIKTEYFLGLCGIVITLIGAAYKFGIDRGDTKFDQIKIDLTEENRILKAEKANYTNRRAKDSVLIDSLQKNLVKLEDDYRTTLFATGVLNLEIDSLKKKIK